MLKAVLVYGVCVTRAVPCIPITCFALWNSELKVHFSHIWTTGYSLFVQLGNVKTREKTRINLSNWWTTLSINNVRMLIQRFTLSVGTLQEWLSYNYWAVLAFTIGYILNVILKNVQVCQLSFSLQLKTTILFQLLRNHKTTITIACLR